MDNQEFHKSVLVQEAVEFLNVKAGKTYIDATFGGGGHTKKIIDRGGKVLAVDIDAEAVKRGAKLLSLNLKQEKGYLFAESRKLTLVRGNFAHLEKIARDFGVWETPGILFDLGISSGQLEKRALGLSFLKDEPLDMRLDPSLGIKAADLINILSERQLYELFTKFGEESDSRRVARALVKARVKEKISTSKQLADLVVSVLGKRGKIHPATRVFQALRIAVNDELGNLEEGLGSSVKLLGKNGRLVVISFHSLEDRIVKRFFASRGQIQVLTKKVLTPTAQELEENPRSRSARLRAAEKQ